MKDLKSNLASKIDRIFAITIIVLLTIYSVALTYYTDTLQEQLYERDVLIEKLSKRDSILNKVFTINYDSLNNTTSYSYIERDGEIVKYDVLANDLNRVKGVLGEKEEKLAEVLYIKTDLEDQLSVTQERYDTLVFDYNKLVGMYNSLGKDYYLNSKKADSILKLMDKSLDSMAYYKAISNHVQSNYGFKIRLDVKNRSLQITNPSLDSALILYPYFKDRLTYDSAKRVWVIEIEKTNK